MGKVLKFFQLTSRDRQLIVFTALLLSFVRLGFLLFPFPKLKQILHRFGQRTPSPNPHNLMALIWAVNAASNLMPGGVKCLARALTMDVLMRRQGYLPNLRLGVLKQADGQPYFHAWVECQGQVIIGYLPNLKDFTPLLPTFSIDPQTQQ
jgi:hypothetical protein